MRALIVVDVQKDFVEGGALACEGGKQAAADITKYVLRHGSRYDKIVFTRDWHTPGEDNGGHFSETPDFKDTWPAHCVAGSTGAEFADGLSKTGRNMVEIRKGQHKPAYSGFEGTEVGTGNSLAGILADADVIDICGIALDYCVKATALDARRLLPQAQVNVLLDLTASVAKGTSVAATVRLIEAGVKVPFMMNGLDWAEEVL